MSEGPCPFRARCPLPGNDPQSVSAKAALAAAFCARFGVSPCAPGGSSAVSAAGGLEIVEDFGVRVPRAQFDEVRERSARAPVGVRRWVGRGAPCC